MTRKSHNQRVLVWTDPHFPYHHPDIFRFLKAIKKKYDPDRVICAGDEIDNHKISFHTKDPDISGSPKDELQYAIKQFSQIYKIFPEIDLVVSNHGSLVKRKIFDAGLPSMVMRPWKEILGAPEGYNWFNELYITMSNGQTLCVHHGIAKNALNVAQSKGMCYISGHYHASFQVGFWNNGVETKWGCNAGCLLDPTNPAFAYGKNSKYKPVLGAVIIINGIPKLIPLVVDSSNKWVGKL